MRRVAVNADSPISVIIGTYGDQSWEWMADTAFQSALDQTVGPREVIHVHGDSLHGARNEGAAAATAPWLCFLDADDRLDLDYVAAMVRALEGLADEGAWLVQPATLGVYRDGSVDPHPVVIPSKRLIDGNFMVIGTLVQRQPFLEVGGFRELPLYEDWDLWLRMEEVGARFIAASDAVYLVGVRSDSRNNQARAIQVETYRTIRSAALDRRKGR
jgi:glycosyltransferase involved in cell wall biosynthesis